MKTPTRFLAVVLLLVLFVSIPAHGQQGEAGDDKTLSPYFFVQSDDPEVDRLPLQSTRSSRVNSIKSVMCRTLNLVY